jgi:hypothetical protein
MANSTDSVVFDREPLKVDRVWTIVATHPSGQQEHILGFHNEAEAEELAHQQRMRGVAKNERLCRMEAAQARAR